MCHCSEYMVTEASLCTGYVRGIDGAEPSNVGGSDKFCTLRKHLFYVPSWRRRLWQDLARHSFYHRSGKDSTSAWVLRTCTHVLLSIFSWILHVHVFDVVESPGCFAELYNVSEIRT
jgi:hypothetical protein